MLTGSVALMRAPKVRASKKRSPKLSPMRPAAHLQDIYTPDASDGNSKDLATP
jgi:hypothetical protein